ncbi:hypothetical protein HMPREF9336_03085 [Segniliparus rugosus ATCC BAA-974]|uniref:Uncharacterized protein n=2 Tax=Segniliparus rugosus TaxID=286804 RepID=E5XUB3_SEGRC|nr:hypothetical protein HMPREF9336_03085 [Segniliparus rugosus ATCC BAA-974]
MCLALRDRHGQLARATVNTDAVLVAALVEAQLEEGSALREPSGRCPLRRFAVAQVVPSSSIGVRLGAVASLALTAAKARDVVMERQTGLAPSGRVKGMLAGVAADMLAKKAASDPEVSAALDVPGLLAEFDRQGETELRARELGLAAVTAASAKAAGHVFAAAARVAGRLENEAPLRRIGAAYGEIAHLVDALDDIEADRRAGAFNPIIATGTPLEAVRTRLEALRTLVADESARLRLTDAGLVRSLLLHGLRARIARAVTGLPAPYEDSAKKRKKEKKPGGPKRARRWDDCCDAWCCGDCCGEGCGECCGSACGCS